MGVLPPSNKNNSARHSAMLRIFNANIPWGVELHLHNRGKPCDKREIIGDKLHINENKLIPEAARSKAWTCGHLIAGIVGTNSSGDMDV